MNKEYRTGAMIPKCAPDLGAGPCVYSVVPAPPEGVSRDTPDGGNRDKVIVCPLLKGRPLGTRASNLRAFATFSGAVLCVLS